MSTRNAGAKWGDARVAFRLIAPQVLEELQRGRTVRSVYEEMKPRFPGGYAQFAKYIQRSAARTEVRSSALAAASRPRNPVQNGKTDGPVKLVLDPPKRQFQLNHDPDYLDELIHGPRDAKQGTLHPSGERGRR
jgi:hypothetical protein